MKALTELEQIVSGQATVRTSKLKPIVEGLRKEIATGSAEVGLVDLAKEVERKEKVIVRLQEESKQHTLVRTRHKAAMQDYENLKKRHNRTQQEYTTVVAARSKDKDKYKKLQRELTDTQVKLAAAERKIKKLEGKK